MLDIVLELEANVTACTWQQNLAPTDTKFHAMHKHWTPAGAKKIATDNIPVSKREFANQLNMLTQQINNLKLKASSSGSGSSACSSGSFSSATVCEDCGVKDVVKGHLGCKNPGAGSFTPEKQGASSQRNGGKPTSSSSSAAIDRNAICTDPIPDNEEKVWNGETWVMCRKC